MPDIKKQNQKKQAVPKVNKEASVQAKKIEPAKNIKKKRKKPKDSHKRFMSKVIFVAVSNLISVILLFVFLGELPKKATELKTLINAKVKAEASSKINIGDLEI